MKKPKDVKRRMRPVVDAILRINDALAAVGEAVAGELAAAVSVREMGCRK
jgi:hypothetical protein